MNKVQVHPEATTTDLYDFIPGLRFYGGIDYHSDGRRPTPSNVGAFFSFQTSHGVEYGHLYDWVSKSDDGEYHLVVEREAENLGWGMDQKVEADRRQPGFWD